jgi:hypothetical protein
MARSQPARTRNGKKKAVALFSGYEATLSGKLSDVKEISIPEGTNLPGSHGNEGKRWPALHGRELDFISLPIAINVHDGSHITRLQFRLRQGIG